jgi:DNA-binding transcriptional MerR regulator
VTRDYGWRTQIRTLLAKGKSLAEIAEVLNSKGVPPAHGTNRWTTAMVRKAYVS